MNIHANIDHRVFLLSGKPKSERNNWAKYPTQEGTLIVSSARADYVVKETPNRRAA
jgi:hypothetical protein